MRCKMGDQTNRLEGAMLLSRYAFTCHAFFYV
jgi:hypothetical protein